MDFGRICRACKWRNSSIEDHPECIDCRVIVVGTNYEPEENEDVEHIASEHEKTE